MLLIISWAEYIFLCLSVEAYTCCILDLVPEELHDRDTVGQVRFNLVYSQGQSGRSICSYLILSLKPFLQLSVIYTLHCTDE